MVAVTYLSARRDSDKDNDNDKADSYFRRSLVWTGGIALLPVFAVLAAGERAWYWNGHLPSMSFSLHVIGWLIAFVLPLLTASVLRGKAIPCHIAFALWIFLVG